MRENLVAAVSNRYLKFLNSEAAPYFASRAKKPLDRQLREIHALWRRYHCLPYHYFKHRLYEHGARIDVLNYFPPELVGRFQRFVNPIENAKLLHDKRETCSALRAAAVPCVSDLLSVSRSGEIFDATGQSMPAQVAAKALTEHGAFVFVKPIDGGVGNGASRRRTEEVANELLSGVARNVVVQPVLHNHPILHQIFPGALNTIRVDTLVDGNECWITAACLKVATGQAQVDNWSKGAIAVGIDLKSGALASSGIRKASFGRTFHAFHPDTGARFGQIVVPWWPEVLELSRRAALALRPHLALGWDIAVTASGPLAIEANHKSDFFLLQETCGPLGQTRLAEKAMMHWCRCKGIAAAGVRSSAARQGL